MLNVDEPISYEAFGELIGVTKQAVSAMVNDGRLERGGSCRSWLLSYVGGLRDVASGRQSPEAVALTVANTQLAHEKILTQQLKNAEKAKLIAPVAILAEVLADASSAVGSALDGLVPTLVREGYELPNDVQMRLKTLVANARNEWIEQTTQVALLDLLSEGDAVNDESDSASLQSDD